MKQIDKNALADYIHASKYGRYIPDLHRREVFKETVLRVKRMHKTKFPKLAKQIDEAFKLVLCKKVLPSMRSMQFAGQPIFERNERMYNCSFTLIDRPDVFGKILYLLLCGVGVGFSVQKQHVAKLPRLFGVNKNLVCHHTIEDTIEGWANSVNALINSFIHGYHVEFNYSKIRPVGSQLQSGGKAPGHLDLKEALEAARKILVKADGCQLRPIECHDIICHLSKAVLAGGIRRSSLISLFSKSDEEMLSCKDKTNFNHGCFNAQRELCNNSVVLNPNTCIKDDLRFIIEWNKKGYGEPGFIFLDDEDTGVNPCGEIGINPVLEIITSDGDWKNTGVNFIKQTGFGFCNLVEINAAACENEIDFYHACNAASFIATLQASYTHFPYLGNVSKYIAERDALIGVSITGMMDAPWIFDKIILQHGVNTVKTQNEVTATEIGINPAVRCTCVKPSGTSSLELGGVSCGIHPHIARTYFKRITANPLEPVAQFFKKYNPEMVDTKPNGDLCITFPIQTDGLIQEDFTALEFLEKIYLVYENWILPAQKTALTHNVSCTVTVEDNEWEGVLDNIWEMRSCVRCLTFLPKMAYKIMPYIPNEPADLKTFEDQKRWKQLIQTYIPVDYELMEEHEDTTLRGAACDGEKCGMEDRTFIEGNGYRVFHGEVIMCPGAKWNEDGLTWLFISHHNGYYIGQRIV